MIAGLDELQDRDGSYSRECLYGIGVADFNLFDSEASAFETLKEFLNAPAHAIKFEHGKGGDAILNSTRDPAPVSLSPQGSGSPEN